MKRKQSLRDEMLTYLASGENARGETSRWNELWRDLVASKTPESEAERLFERLRELAEIQGNTTLRVRASEGRRVYLYGLENPEHAIEILNTFSYHKAIDQFPPIYGRHNLPKARRLRNEIALLVERLDVPQLLRQREWLSSTT